jgi:hypothetical protein
MNHEPRGCIGCHEDGELVPTNRLPAAVTVPSVPAYPPPEQRRSVDFRRDVMPVIARRCVECHRQGGSLPVLASDTKATPLPAARMYEVLLAADEKSTEAAPRGRYVDPGRARTSRLVWHILGRNTSRPWDGDAGKGAAKAIPPGKAEPLSADERQTFITWIDLGAAWQAAPVAGKGK